VTTPHLLLATAVIVGVGLPAWGQLPQQIFSDVPSSAPYYNQVNLLRERMITTGCLASPQMYCPNVDTNGVTPYYLTRGQAAVLIIRSLFSGISGNPDAFYAPQTPYFSDVSPTHPQFNYIQKLRELGITSGCTATDFCPWREISYGEIAVFVYRARQKRLAEWEYAYVLPPPACTYDLYPDVPSTHVFCSYISQVVSAVGPNAVSPECPSGYFCPDAYFDENQQWITGLRVRRGTLAFYLVAGILDADYPWSLPTSSGQLDGVAPPCTYDQPVYTNLISVAGQQMLAISETALVTFSGPPNAFTFVVDRTLLENTTVKYPVAPLAVGGMFAHRDTPWFTFDPAKNYQHNVNHQIAVSCAPNGSLTAFTKPPPTVLSVDQTVLYRGMQQSVSFRGLSLQSPLSAVLDGSYLPVTASNVSEFAATLSFVTPVTALAGQRELGVWGHYQGQYPQGSGYGNTLPVTVADPTPVLSSLSEYSGTQGDPPFTVTLSGMYFGANPQVCISGSCTNSPNAASTGTTSVNGVFLTRSPFTPHSNVISVTLNLSSAAEGTYSITVQSLGAVGNGFAYAPNGGSMPGSAGLAFQVRTQLVSMKLERVGPTIINSSNNYSEDTTIRVTAVNRITGATLVTFTGTVNLAEDGTAIYSQNLGSLPPSVVISSGGTVTFVAKSLAGPKVVGQEAPDAARIRTTNYPIYGGAPLDVPQWIIPPEKIHQRAGQGVYAWLQARAADIYASASGDAATVLAALSTYTVSNEVVGAEISGTVLVINPFSTPLRLNIGGGPICGNARTKGFKNLFLHEARHAYQHVQSQVAGNDPDGDYLVNGMPIAPTMTAVDTTALRDVCDAAAGGSGVVLSKGYKGATIFDSYEAPDHVGFAIEMDAYVFAAAHEN